MTEWYVKDLSKLTSVSIQTLHHYDKIGLLKPSTKSESRYRIYSEMDLLKLQQIIALKFFGFSLKQIKKLLAGGVDVAEQFASQVLLLNEKAKALLNASDTLQNIIAECQFDQPLPWKTILKTIEVFRRAQTLETTLRNKVFTEDEMKQYARFKADFESRFSKKEQENFEDKYVSLVESVKSRIHENPNSTVGIKIAAQYMEMINEWYTDEHANLKHAIWKSGYQKGVLSGRHNLTPEIITWLGTACEAYYDAKIRDIFDVTKTNLKQAKLLLNNLIREYAGNSKELKQNLLHAMMAHPAATTISKKWLQQFSKKTS